MEEDTELELEALQAVYGEDCIILQRWPPQVEVLLKPRTADELSQQFVEIVVAIKANEKYPANAPGIELVAIKGLDAVRQANLLSVLRLEADRLSNEPMLVAIFESAVEFLTTNNYPEGECCFCLLPLLDHFQDQMQRPCMKLMSCFHCFHSDCFANWWNWLSLSNEMSAYCPICRAPVHAEGVAHFKQQPEGQDVEETLLVFAELIRNEAQRQADFSKNLEAQRALGGIIEPRGALTLTLVDPPEASEQTQETPDHTSIIRQTTSEGHSAALPKEASTEPEADHFQEC